MSANRFPPVKLEELPAKRWYILLAGTILLFGVYYLIYGGEFHEGAVEAESPFSLPFRILAVALIVWSLRPFRIQSNPAWAITLLYFIFAFSLFFAAITVGELNDTLFFNTLLQLPILWALTLTQWKFDFARWMRAVGVFLAVQVVIDIILWAAGQSLWQSQAFVGGVGNPSSFGLSCAVLFVFFMFHPNAGRGRFVLALVLAMAALMSKSLFAVLGVFLVYLIWSLKTRRRLLVTLIAAVTLVVTANGFFGEGEDESFLVHKLRAAAAFSGLIEYDIDSSATVSMRAEMHEQTFAAIARHPLGLLIGHLDDKPYWQMDSQLLTYLGSFGAVALSLFLLLHLYWTFRAYRRRRLDGGFSLLVFTLFGFVFATNRILDYFPMATLYFVCIALVTTTHERGSRQLVSNIKNENFRN